MQLSHQLFVVNHFASFLVMIATGLADERIVYIACCAYADLLASMLHVQTFWFIMHRTI